MTAPNTPQMNGVVERAFTIFTERGRAMMEEANMPRSVQQVLWAECFNTAGLISNLMKVGGRKDSPLKMFYGNKAKFKFAKNMKKFGEAVFVTNRDKIKAI